jgi:hypothetical protein
MRNARIREDQAANYHVMSRVVDDHAICFEGDGSSFFDIVGSLADEKSDFSGNGRSKVCRYRPELLGAFRQQGLRQEETK